MADDTIRSLRRDTRNLFYHGYDNYMRHAFPEDELAPLSCKPQTRNRDNPADIGLNDVLGNYSLTLVDSLSTLAILASGDEQENREEGRDPLRDFQSGVRSVVELYGDGRQGSCGSRACGFDLDSKVQVFETNIRGVGGLLSAHLFAIGELPIRGYKPVWVELEDGTRGTEWGNGELVYSGQLLRLAHDLASRLLPAFSTATGLPYPRVNLRHGIPFYHDAETGVCRLDGTSSDPREITETCAAGAGSLVLEFTTLSRLTGDDRFEKLAKKAFWAVWSRRSPTGLVGGGIDAESGQWTLPPLAGIGAGIDSFFEYAFKSHILLSGLDDGSATFLDVWTQAHASITHHIRRPPNSEKHPFYGQSDLFSGAHRCNWIDNLSAYYPGLLTLAGLIDEAIESHLLFSALWTRYSALPERWHTFNGGFIDANFHHWAGRPEFIESTWYLYQATKDPWFLHTGEMVLRDVRRRCWVACGWADLGDVVSGELRDRMESFFLGETAKYLFLLFQPDHPLNTMDGNFVFSTEGHPLVIPKSVRKNATGARKPKKEEEKKEKEASTQPTCPIPPSPLPLTLSNTANRHDLFHAAALANLHLVPINPARSSPLLEASNSSPGISLADIRSPTNYTFYPWTLPQNLIPAKGTSSPIKGAVISTLTFPDLTNTEGEKSSSPASNLRLPPFGAIQKVLEGVLITSLSNVRLSMVQESRAHLQPDGVQIEVGKEFRVQGIANWALGRDEKVLVSGQALEGVSPADPHFTRVRDLEWVDLVVEVGGVVEGVDEVRVEQEVEVGNGTLDRMMAEVERMVGGFLGDLGVDVEVVQSQPATSAITSVAATPINAKNTQTDTTQPRPSVPRHLIPAILPTGAGVAPLPSHLELTDAMVMLPNHKTFFLDSTLCTHALPAWIAKSYSILVIRRGECSFNEKLANIPAFVPSSESLQLVIVLDNSGAGRGDLIRPLLETVQRTPTGLERKHAVAMVLVDGLAETEKVFWGLASGKGGFDEGSGKVVEAGETGSGQGFAVKRRYWFESMGVPIGNLIVL
ncbi:hypothetical protein LTR37_020622 [Vermiconidia calcicola]|uniref:Uncharacterized protein n=1 Tax=Vermiconidia calcicola TaxID=1690605 RepID=A0ACC3MAY9_9PEZI|nr:hypothetical protein LTR37_020622 [Vermiconidia calcicola]